MTKPTQPPSAPGHIPPDGAIGDSNDSLMTGSWRLVRSRWLRLDKRRQYDTATERFLLPPFSHDQIVTVNLVAWRVRYSDDDEHLLDASIYYSWERRTDPVPGWQFVIKASLRDNDLEDRFDADVAYRVDTWAPIDAPAAMHLVHRAGGIPMDGVDRSVETPLEWDTQVVRDSLYWSNGIEFRANDYGLYSITVQCSVRVTEPTETDRCAPAIAMQKTLGTVTTDLPGAICYGYARANPLENLSATLSIQVVAELHEGMTIRCVLFNGSQDRVTAETAPESTRLTVQLIRRL